MSHRAGAPLSGDASMAIASERRQRDAERRTYFSEAAA